MKEPDLSKVLYHGCHELIKHVSGLSPEGQNPSQVLPPHDKFGPWEHRRENQIWGISFNITDLRFWLELQPLLQNLIPIHSRQRQFI